MNKYVFYNFINCCYYWNCCFLFLATRKNYELKFKESIVYFAAILLFLISFDNLGNAFTSLASLLFSVILFIVLLIYYFIRSVKLSKYVPFKIIILYSIMVLLIICFPEIDATFGIFDLDISFSGFITLTLFYYSIASLNVVYIVLLLLINAVMFIVNCLKSEKKDYNNKDYKITKYF